MKNTSQPVGKLTTKVSPPQAIARKARTRGTGTRSLRSLMESLLHASMFEAPALAAANRSSTVVLNGSAVEEGSAHLVTEGNEPYAATLLAEDEASSSPSDQEMYASVGSP